MSIVLTNEWTKQTMARAVDGAYYERGEGWVVDNPDARTAAVICTLFPELQQAHPELTALRDTLLGDSRPFDNATPFNTRIKAPLVEAQLATEGFSLHDYQAIDLGYVQAVLRKHQAAIIAWQMGLGKTLAACALIDSLVAQRVLVLCPNVAKVPVWKAEIERWLPGVPVLVCPNGPPTRREKMLADIANRHEPFIFICHYEAIDLIAQMRSAGRGWDRLGEWDLVVADEVHILSNPKTKMHRATMKIPTSMKLGLTGDLMRDKPEDVFGILKWCFPKIYRSKWRDYMNRFVDTVESGYGKVVIGFKAPALPQLREELGVFTVLRRSSDELDLPTKVERDLYVDLSPAQQKAYDQLRDECVARLDSGETIVGLQPITMLSKLRQLATGMELVSDAITDSTKLDLAEELVAEAGGDSVVVFGWHRAAVAAMAERLGDRALLITGDVTMKQRAERLAEFDAARGRVICATISTCAQSLNLQAASHVVFIELSFSPAQNSQAVSRCHRQNQTRPVTVTRIIARDTVDQLQQQPLLQTKQQIRLALLGSEK